MISSDNETKLHIYEVYADAAAFEAHLNNSLHQVAGIVVAKLTPAQ